MCKCPQCDALIEKDTKYCPNCGCNLEETFVENPVCPVCRKTYPTGTRYCADDGAALVAPEKLTPRCVICGKEYPEDVKYCSIDGGAVLPEALHNTYNNRTDTDVNDNAAKYKPASLGRRFCAYLLDAFFSFLLALPALFCFFGTITASVLPDYKGDLNNATFVLVALLFFFLLLWLPLLYNLFKDGFGNGQSWGKRIMDIKVINLYDGSKCTKGTSAIRQIVSWVIGLVPVVGWLIEPILVIATADGRRLADRAAGTMVVNA